MGPHKVARERITIESKPGPSHHGFLSHCVISAPYPKGQPNAFVSDLGPDVPLTRSLLYWQMPCQLLSHLHLVYSYQDSLVKWDTSGTQQNAGNKRSSVFLTNPREKKVWLPWASGKGEPPRTFTLSSGNERGAKGPVGQDLHWCPGHYLSRFPEGSCNWKVSSRHKCCGVTLCLRAGACSTAGTL